MPVLSIGTAFEHLQSRTLMKDGKLTTFQRLFETNSVVGLYFGAEWSQPCRDFTLALKQFFSAFQSGSESQSDISSKSSRKDLIFDIIYVSSDADKEAFQRIAESMPWWKLPFEDCMTATRLRRLCKIRNVPSLVLINADTKVVITKEGRNALQEDPQGTKFPWYPPPATAVLCGKLLSKKSSDLQFESLKDTVKAIYFGANWCPPCKLFTKQLIGTYQKLKQKPFEIIFCSSDRSEDGFRQMFDCMPWLAFPFGDPRAALIPRIFDIHGIPALLILDQDNQVITRRGRNALLADPEGLEFPWYLKPLNELNEFNYYRLKEEVCVILFNEGTPEDINLAISMMENTAEVFFENSDDQEITFFYSGEDPICDQILDSLGLGEAPLPLVCIIDTMADSFYVCEDQNVSEGIVRSFIRNYIDGILTPRKLKVDGGIQYGSPTQAQD